MRGAILFHHFDLVNRVLKGGHETIEWVCNGTDTGGFGGTNKPFSVHGVSVMDVHGTKLTRETAYWDLAKVLREIGRLWCSHGCGSSVTGASPRPVADLLNCTAAGDRRC